MAFRGYAARPLPTPTTLGVSNDRPLLMNAISPSLPNNTFHLLFPSRQSCTTREPRAGPGQMGPRRLDGRRHRWRSDSLAWATARLRGSAALCRRRRRSIQILVEASDRGTRARPVRRSQALGHLHYVGLVYGRNRARSGTRDEQRAWGHTAEPRAHADEALSRGTLP